MTIWQPGMRCVCIREERVAASFDVKRAVVGTVYTVREVAACSVTGVAMICLAEIDNRHLVGSYVLVDGRWYALGSEPGFAASCFRPLSEARLDVFRKMLAPTSRQPAEASS